MLTVSAIWRMQKGSSRWCAAQYGYHYLYSEKQRTPTSDLPMPHSSNQLNPRRGGGVPGPPLADDRRLKATAGAGRLDRIEEDACADEGKGEAKNRNANEDGLPALGRAVDLDQLLADGAARA